MNKNKIRGAGYISELRMLKVIRDSTRVGLHKFPKMDDHVGLGHLESIFPAKCSESINAQCHNHHRAGHNVLKMREFLKIQIALV